jgi:hypothetical protein
VRHSLTGEVFSAASSRALHPAIAWLCDFDTPFDVSLAVNIDRICSGASHP